ncbi:MAG: hypothetical protein ACK4UN_16270, partial [Limisphaerales bacterium]
MFMRLLTLPCFIGAFLISTSGATQQGGVSSPAIIDASRFDSLQAAFNALPTNGGIIRLPPGNFEIQEPLLLTVGETRIEGAGAATRI